MSSAGASTTVVEQHYLDVANRLPLDQPLTAGCVPKLGDANIAHLTSADGFGLSNWAEFYGRWLLVNRNEEMFVEWMTNKANKSKHNILVQFAKPAAAAVATRFKLYDFLSQEVSSLKKHKATDTMSGTEAAFIAEKLPKGPLAPGFVPSLGVASVEKLKAGKIQTFDELFAQWFLWGRNAEDLQSWLEEKGVGTKEAAPIAKAIHARLDECQW